MLTKTDLQSISNIVTTAIEPVSQRLDKVEIRLGTVESRLGNLEKKVTKIKKDTSLILNEIDKQAMRAHRRLDIHDKLHNTTTISA